MHARKEVQLTRKNSARQWPQKQLRCRHGERWRLCLGGVVGNPDHKVGSHGKLARDCDVFDCDEKKGTGLQSVKKESSRSRSTCSVMFARSLTSGTPGNCCSGADVPLACSHKTASTAGQIGGHCARILIVSSWPNMARGWPP